MNLELPLGNPDPSALDDLLEGVETVVDDLFLAEVEAAFERIRTPERDEAAA